MVDLIHIGDYKTGTTWWQHFGYSYHPEIYYLDNPKKHIDIVALLNALVLKRDLDFDTEYFRDKFAEVFNNIYCGEKKTVICRELLSGKFVTGDHARRNAMRLFSVFEGAKILIVVREQFSMLKSMYSQYVKMGGTLPIYEFVYDPIVSPGLLERLKYHKIIDTYVELFGRANVKIGLFNEFIQDKSLFAREVYEFIGVSTNVTLPSENYVNRSLRLPIITLLRYINRFRRTEYNPSQKLFPIENVISLLLPDRVKKRLIIDVGNHLIYNMHEPNEKFILKYCVNQIISQKIAGLAEKIQIGPRVHLPIRVSQELDDEFIASNRILRDRYGLDVGQHGWKL